MVIDAEAISQKFLPVEGFRHPDWPQIFDWVRNNVAEPTADTWNGIVRVWLGALQEDLGGSYDVFENSHTFLLADLSADAARRLQKFASEAIAQMREAWPGVAWEGRGEKVVILLFSEADDYYSYISRFFGDGQSPQSSGVWLGAGYTHIAAQLEGEVSAAVTILHELCHDAFGHLTLPRWLDEGIARTLERTMAPRAPSFGETESDLLWGDVTGWKSPMMWAELADLHFTFWNADNIQEFWAGRSFQIAGDSMSLSYSLAEVLLKLITDESSKQSFTRFLAAAGKENDAGQTAAQQTLGLDLGEIAATFLGPGDWRPNPTRIAELIGLVAPNDPYNVDFHQVPADGVELDEIPSSLDFIQEDASSETATPTATQAFSFDSYAQITTPFAFYGQAQPEPIELNSGINELDSFAPETLRFQLEQSGYAVFVLPTGAATNEKAFFEAARAIFQLNPPGRRDDWTAFSDSLFQALVDHPSNDIAILLPNPLAHESNPAIEHLSDIALGLLDPQSTNNNPKRLAIVIGAAQSTCSGSEPGLFRS